MSPGGKDAILLVDRGSREQVVQDELRTLSERVRLLGGFDIAEFALLEVRGPTIEEGLASCARAGAERVVVYPYFLHNGMKCHAALEKVRELSARSSLEIVAVEAPLGVDQMLVDMVLSRLRDLKAANPLVRDEDCQVLIAGHGSSYPEEKRDFQSITESIKEQSGYAGVTSCFLEIAKPTIEEGIRASLGLKPTLLLMVPYFLHYGAHLQRDIPQELERISKSADLSKVRFGRHLGTDPLLAELVMKRVRESIGWRKGQASAPDDALGPRTLEG